MCGLKWFIIALCVLAAGCGSNNDELAADTSASLDVASVQTATAISTQQTEHAQTRVAERATQAAIMPSPSPTPSIEPRYVTVTAFVDRATSIALTMAAGITPSPTPEPTLSPQELDTLGDQWLRELEAAVGFSHPALNDIVEEMKRDANLGFVHPEWVRDYPLEITVEQTTFEDTTYMAVNIAVPFPFCDTNHFLMFRLENGTPSFLSDFSQPNLRMEGGFSDLNGNKLPDLRLFFPPGCANFPAITITMIEIRPGGEIVNITPDFGEIYRLDTVDLNGDGILDFKATGCMSYPDYWTCKMSGPSYVQYYVWDGSAYENISSTLDVSFWPETLAYWEYADQQGGCLLPDWRMYHMLIDYTARGKLDEGWTILEPRLCTSEADEQGKESLDELRGWVTRRLTIEQLGRQWLAELETTVEFSHPALQEMIWDLRDNSEYSPIPRLRAFEPNIEIEEVTYDEATYEVVLVENPFSTNWNNTHLRAFRKRDGQIDSIPNVVHLYPSSIHGDGFADRNGNGLPDIAFDTSNNNLIVLEVSPGGELVNITPDVEYPRQMYLVDLDSDGIDEIEAVHCGYIPAANGRSDCKEYSIYYRWNETSYEDITPTLDDSFFPATVRAWQYVNQPNHCLSPLGIIYEVLIDYIARDKLEEGWALLEPRLCTPEADGQGKERLDELREWVAQQLADSD